MTNMVVVNEMMAFNHKHFMNLAGQGVKREEVELNNDKNFNINDYINEVPLLVNEMTDDEDELESRRSVKESDVKDVEYFENSVGSSIDDVGSSIDNVGGSIGNGARDSINPTTDSINPTNTSVGGVNESNKNKSTKKTKSLRANRSLYKQEKNQLMMVVIKYISIKITNLFPPSSSESKISLEKFLIIMINRLKMSLPNFLKSIIYLFRYMDIIYLLRYLNQSNNFANFTEMDFPLKKLIIGCFKLTLMRERINKDWGRLTGLSDNDVNVVIQSILKRLNNKIIIKESEINKFKSEVLRYVKMVSDEVP